MKLSDMSWFTEELIASVTRAHDAAWSSEAVGAPSTQGSAQNQNHAMLLKFFLQQLAEPNPPGPITSRIIARDFVTTAKLRERWTQLAAQEGVQWLVLGLSFADYRFHVYCLGDSRPVPFCVTPVAVCCLHPQVLNKSRREIEHFAAAQFDNMPWTVVEARLQCLQEPLDLFTDPGDCQENCHQEP